jgi:hypothetical protein
MTQTQAAPSRRLFFLIVAGLLVLGGGGFMVWATRPPIVTFQIAILARDGGHYPVEFGGVVVGNTPLVVDEASLAGFTRQGGGRGAWPPPVPANLALAGGGSFGSAGLLARHSSYEPLDSTSPNLLLIQLEGAAGHSRIELPWRVLSPSGARLGRSGIAGSTLGSLHRRQLSLQLWVDSP